MTTEWIRPQLEPARGMPELVHWDGKMEGREFDLKKSEVVRWLSECGPVMVWLVDKLRRRGIIRYDAERNVWVGVPKLEAKAMSNTPDPADFESGQPGRPRKVDPELLLACFTEAEPEMVGLNAWAKRMAHLGVSSKTFKRMVDRLVASGKVVRAAGQITSAPGRFPNMAVYRLVKPAENIPDFIPPVDVPVGAESPAAPAESSTKNPDLSGVPVVDVEQYKDAI